MVEKELCQFWALVCTSEMTRERILLSSGSFLRAREFLFLKHLVNLPHVSLAQTESHHRPICEAITGKGKDHLTAVTHPQNWRLCGARGKGYINKKGGRTVRKEEGRDGLCGRLSSSSTGHCFCFLSADFWCGVKENMEKPFERFYGDPLPPNALIFLCIFLSILALSLLSIDAPQCKFNFSVRLVTRIQYTENTSLQCFSCYVCFFLLLLEILVKFLIFEGESHQEMLSVCNSSSRSFPISFLVSMVF